MGKKIQSQGWLQRYENPKFSWGFFFFKEKIKLQNNFEREPTEKKFAKDQPPKFERNKIPAKAKRGF